MQATLQIMEELGPTRQAWERIGFTHHHGINVPLFSLRTERSCGIGEFPDLLPLVDWCREIGFNIIQLLPLNDTGLDTSPYNAISSCALNPNHLSLEQLPEIDKKHPNIVELKKYNETGRVAYSKVRYLKTEFLWYYFQEKKGEILADRGYLDFLRDHHWLQPYALYKTLKAKHNWEGWLSWDPELQDVNPTLLDELIAIHHEEVHFHQYVQYLCFQQFHSVKAYANERGIFIKGDIPILISPDSADVWEHRSIFDVNLCAGVPPDYINSLGQNWRFPIYKWDAIEKEDYSWWKQRLHTAELLYDIYRIDHIVGFFRIWAIPPGREGIDGSFLPKDRRKWGKQGKKILEMMCRSSMMLPVGEDLGTIPPITRKVMRELGIARTRVLRWEWDKKKKGFIDPHEFEPVSMCTVSTHDVAPLKLWWYTQAKKAEEYAKWRGWKWERDLSYDYHLQMLTDAHQRATSLLHINLLQEYLTLFPELHWPNLQNERVNYAGTVCDLNWTSRYRPTVEEIVSHAPLKDVMRELSSRP